jgi:hypothetical protein
MEARDYCSALQTEVDGWKSKVHDAFGKLDHVPSSEKASVNPIFSELRAIIEEHTTRMERLSRQCPAELGAQLREGDQFMRLKKFWQDLGKYRRYRVHL